MRRILQNKNDRSKNQAFQNRMAAIIGRLIEAGFDGMSFKQERDFLLSLYPFAHKEYCIRVWRTNETDYRWEAKGRFSDKTIEGYFQSMDCQGVSVETSVDCIAGKEITDDERKLLAEHGLADKSLWFDSDIKKVWKLLNVYAADNNFCNFC